MGVIKEDQQVKLVFTIADGSEAEVTCRVKSFDNDRIYLKPSTAVDSYLNYLQEGDEVTAKVFTPIGIQMYDAIIINSPLEDDFIIEYTEKNEQIQRREYLRFPFCAKIVIERDNKEMIVTNTIDMSGGGLKFVHNKTFENEEIVKLSLCLDNEKMIKASGLIISNINLPEGQVALSFMEINEHDRDRIIKKSFDVQLGKG